MKVALIGATPKKDRYAYLALKLLQEKGHTVYPVHPLLTDIEGTKVYPSIGVLPEKVDTVTMYVGKAASDKVAEEILAAKPERIIFNPGAENPDLEKEAKRRGIETLDACTLVMLKTGQF